MFGIINFEVFLVAAVLLNVTPGTDTMYIVSRSVTQGRKAGIYSALGITLGVVIHTLLAGFGLSIILMKSTVLFTVIKVIGALYLAYLGIRMLLTKSEATKRQNLAQHSYKKIFMQGIITNVTNPKVALFFLAFIPQFISHNTEQATALPFIILGLTFTLTSIFWVLIVAFVASMTTNKLRSNQKTSTILNKLTGLVFIAMGIKLLQTKQIL